MSTVIAFGRSSTDHQAGYADRVAQLINDNAELRKELTDASDGLRYTRIELNSSRAQIAQLQIDKAQLTDALMIEQSNVRAHYEEIRHLREELRDTQSRPRRAL